MTPILIAIALLFAPMGPPPTPPVLSPAGEAVITAWQARFDAVKTRQAAAGPPATTAEALARMVELDQAGEAATKDLAGAGLSPEDLRGVQVIAGFTLRVLAHNNLEALKARLPAKGWFDPKRDGPSAPDDGWWIVWRSDDPAFAEEALKRMAPGARNGLISGEKYARLFDRTAIEAGRPQRYGAYSRCEGGIRVVPNLEKPKKVDGERRKIRWSATLADSKAAMKIGEAC